MKEKQIFHLIRYLESNRFASGQSCADAIGVSLSTLKRELKRMAGEFAQNGFTICGRTGHGNGYTCMITDRDKFEAYCTFLSEQISCSENQDFNVAENRIRYVIGEFLSGDEAYILMENLMNELLLSHSQFAKDMKSVREFFQSRNINIISKPHYGSRLNGTEKDIRACIAALMLNQIQLDDEGYIELAAADLPEHQDEISRITDILVRYCSRSTYDLNDITARYLSAQFAVSAQRIRSGHCIELDPKEKEDLLDERYRALAEKIIRDLEELYQIHFNEDELCYAIMYLTAMQMGHHDQLTQEINETVMEMLEKVYEKHRLDLRNDQNLITYLGLHTAALMKRLHFHAAVVNPYLRDIRTNYIVSYDIALSACSVLEKKYHSRISPDEVAYYALHFKIAIDRYHRTARKRVLIICSSGRGTAKMLEDNMYVWFSGMLAGVDTCNMFELKKISPGQYDCVFSTEHLREPANAPVIQISPFFDNADKRIIENALSRKNNREDGSFYFREEYFFTNINAADRHEAISRIVGRLKQITDLPSGFEESVLERENLQNTSLGLIAFPHTYGIITDEPVISISILDHAVKWGKEYIQIILLTAFPENFEKENPLFYSFIRALARTRQFSRALIQSRSYDTLLDLYEEVIRKGHQN